MVLSWVPVELRWRRLRNLLASRRANAKGLHMRIAQSRDIRVEELPRYERPPIAEVAIGLFFRDPIELVGEVIVELRKRISGEYPKESVHLANPIGKGFAKSFEAEFKQSRGKVLAPRETPGGGLEISLPKQMQMPRYWNEGGEHGEFLIQFQHDRVVLNWRRRLNSVYPQFDGMMERLGQVRQHLLAACKVTGEDVPVVDAVEVTYVDNVPLENEFRCAGDVYKGFGFGELKSLARSDPFSENVAAAFVLNDESGTPVGRLGIVQSTSQEVRSGKLTGPISIRGHITAQVDLTSGVGEDIGARGGEVDNVVNDCRLVCLRTFELMLTEKAREAFGAVYRS